MNAKAVTDELRAQYTNRILDFLRENYDDVCQIAAGSMMFPVVDSAGEDRWVKVSVIIPENASEENGTDGYSLAAEYRAKLDKKAARKAEKEKNSRIAQEKKNSAAKI